MKIWITSDGRKVTLVKNYYDGRAWWSVLYQTGLDRYTVYCDIENEFNNIFTRRKKNAIATVRIRKEGNDFSLPILFTHTPHF